MSSSHMPLSHEGAGASPESPVLDTSGMEKSWEARTAIWDRGTGIVLPVTVVATVPHSPTTSSVPLEAVNHGRCPQQFYPVSVGRA